MSGHAWAGLACRRHRAISLCPRPRSVTINTPSSFGPITPQLWPNVRLRTASLDDVTFQPYAIVPLLVTGPGVGGTLIAVGFKAYGTSNMTYASGAVMAAVDGAAPFPLGFDLASFLVTDDTCVV